MIVQRVIWHVVFHDVAPDLACRPRGERVDLDEAELWVALDDAGTRARRRLVPADGRHPCVQAPEHLLQRLDLAQRAAEVRLALPEPLAVFGRLRIERKVRRSPLEADAVPSLQLIA